MKSSLMPMLGMRAGECADLAPIAAPATGARNTSPISAPQTVPPSAPLAVRFSGWCRITPARGVARRHHHVLGVEEARAL